MTTIKKDKLPKLIDCPKCSGTGKIKGEKCPKCKGTGKVNYLLD